MTVKPHCIDVKESSSPIGFEQVGGGAWKVWDRFLTIDGKRAYHIGNICETCRFFFERLHGANRSVSAGEIAQRLNTGNEVESPALISTLTALLPIGQYLVALTSALPQLVNLGSREDYFANEQIETWGIDPFWALPHHPRIQYYRGRTVDLGERRQLFEFIIPMYPSTMLKTERLKHYQADMQDIRPTAVGISVLDVKGPVEFATEEVTDTAPLSEHWCLAHYLLDGHHKTFAAAQAKKPLRLISFVAVNQSIATADQIATALTSLTD